jgi:hypothetical protein
MNPATELRLHLHRNGYAPIPVQGKIPPLKGWQDKLISNAHEIELWSRIYYYAGNTGILTARTPAFDIDILDPQGADAVEALVRERFEERGDILVRFGKLPKRAILFRTDQPFKKIAVNFIAHDGSSDQKLEFLGDGQQLVVHGVHPITKQPYYWRGEREPGQIPYEELPYITAEQARDLVESAADLLCSEHRFSRRGNAAGEPKNGGEAAHTDGPTSWAAFSNLIDHDELASFAMTLLRSGMQAGAALNFLRTIVGKLEGVDPERKQRRLNEIPGIVSSAQNKCGMPGVGASWDDPDWSIIEDRRGELPEFPLHLLTAPWREMLELLAHGAGVTTAHVAVPLLGVASSMIGMARRVKASHTWREPMTLWTCLVAASGDRKTPAMRAVLRPLDQIEAGRSEITRIARLAHETKAQKATEAKKMWQQERKEALEAKPPQLPPTMPPDALDPGEFVAPRLYSNDATIEKLARLLQARPRGLLQFRDELSGLFANMQRYNRGTDRPFWLETWNGGRHVVERVAMSIVVDHLLVGIVGSFQPDKLSRAFNGDEDGMYGRFLYAWTATPAYRPLSVIPREFEPELINALKRLVDLSAETEDGTFAPQDVPLTRDAVQTFEEFRQLVDKEKRALDGREQQWWVKTETHVLRLAGTLCFMSWSMPNLYAAGFEGITSGLEPTEVPEEFVAAAIELVTSYFWPHARAALRQIGATERHANARRLMRWVKAQTRTEISVKDARRDALAQKLDAQETEDLLNQLCKAGWLRKVSTSSVDPKGRGRTVHRWVVNPALFGT